jgi:hypothetical protein
MDKLQRNSAKAGFQLSKQIKSLAFNMKGWAMEDGMKSRPLNQLICAWEPSSTHASDIIEYAEKKGQLAAEPFRNYSSLTNREKGHPSNSVKQYLIVGYVLRESEEVYLKSNPKPTNQKKVGSQHPPNVIKLDEASPLLLVVVDPNQDNKDAALFMS